LKPKEEFARAKIIWIFYLTVQDRGLLVTQADNAVIGGNRDMNPDETILLPWGELVKSLASGAVGVAMDVDTHDVGDRLVDKES